MFDLVEKNKTTVQVVLALVSLGLVASVGIGGFSAFQQSGDFLAKVGGVAISERDIQEATNNRNIDESMKPAVLEQLVERQMLEVQAANEHMAITEEGLSRFIATLPQFQVDGKFDEARANQLIASQNMTPQGFRDRIKRDLMTTQLIGGVANAGFTSSTMQSYMSKLIGEKREVSFVVLQPKEFASSVNVSDAEIKQYYDSHTKELKLPARVKLEYLVLSQAEIANNLQVSDEEVQKYFDANTKAFSKEERKVSHILFNLAKDAKPAEVAAIKKQAEEVLQEVNKNPARFSELARQKSQDQGSASKGGDLGWMSRGGPTGKVLDDAVFSLNKNQISALVRTDYGFHIIRLDDVRTQSLADVKPEIIARLKKQKAQSEYTAQLAKLGEIVYQQADSLQPAAKELKLEIKKSDWVTSAGGKEPELANAKLAAAVFSDDVLKKKHNSDSVEVSPGVSVSARVIEYRPESVPSLAEVSTSIADKLREEKGGKKAVEEGGAKLKALQAGQNVALSWSEPQELVRMGGQQLPEEQVKAIFSLAPDKLPAYVGTEIKNVGYVLFKVSKVIPAEASTPDKDKLWAQQLSQVYGQTALSAYQDSLRKTLKVEYKLVQQASQPQSK